MAFKDNREFIEALDKTGDVVHIREEVDWDIEVGAIQRRACETGAPACLFENIKDYPPGYRILGNPIATQRRLAIALGLAPETSAREIQAVYERRMEQPIKPIVVNSGPCKENIITGDDVDLFRFPAPLEHEGDGCRFIGSWHVVVAKDPDSDWTNWGMYRLGIHSKRYIAGNGWHGGSDLGKILFSKYVPKKKPMPVAIAIGVDPLSTLVAVAPLGIGVNEVDYAGGLMGEPVKLVKCETSDLLVPASTEIVIEGEILPDVKVPDGPFGDFPGYQVWGWLHRACLVKAITHRNDPILPTSNLGLPIDDSDIALTLTSEVAIKKLLQERGVPITGVHCPPEAQGLMVVVGVRKLYDAVADHVFSVIDSRAPEFQHMIMVVDEDVDVFNLGEVMHAFFGKCHPARGIKINNRRLVSGLVPYLSPEERKAMTGASVMFDCTWPRGWSRETDIIPRLAFKQMSPSEIRDKVIAKWQSYGFK